MALIDPSGSELHRPVRVVFEEDSGRILAHLDLAEYEYRQQPVRVRGITFAPKEALHITIVSDAAAEVLAAWVAAHPEEASEIREVMAETDWSFRKLDTFHHMVESPGVETVIQMVEIPALQPFYQSLSRIVGQGLLLPPTHVTLYLRGTEQGIGLPNGEVFARRNAGPLDQIEFVLLPPDDAG